MASVKKRGKTWYLCYLDHRGQHVQQACKEQLKGAAQRLAEDLERQAERQRLGLEALPSKMTFNELLDLWFEKHAKLRLRTYKDDLGRARLHLRPALGDLPLLQVTPMRLEELLNAKLHSESNPKGLSAQSVVHLRGLVRRAFNAAKRWRIWSGENPAELVVPPKVVRKKPSFALAADVPKLLEATSGEFRVLAAVAIYSGLREGEIVALKRTDIHLELGLIHVERTVGSETTKTKKARPVPIAPELRPLVEQHLAQLQGEYLFPEHRTYKEGSLRTHVLRELKAAKVKAGMVERWDHICRRKTCREIERHPDSTQRRCSACNYMLWPRPIPIPLTFHGLRHTYVSHLLMRGADPVAVQRMAGHATLEMTLAGYGHLVPDYLKDQGDRLSFGFVPGLYSEPPKPKPDGEKDEE